MKLSDASETIKKASDASGMFLKPSDASGTIVIDFRWNQDYPNENNRKTLRSGAIRDDPYNWRIRTAQSLRLEKFNN